MSASKGITKYKLYRIRIRQAVTFTIAAVSGIYIYKKPPQIQAEYELEDVDEGIYDRLAKGYDNLINTEETMLGLSWLRWNMTKNVKGNVLELSSGTGRNLPFYKFGKVDNLVFLDKSLNMLQEMRYKFITMGEEEKFFEKYHKLKVFILQGDIENLREGLQGPQITAQKEDQPQQMKEVFLQPNNSAQDKQKSSSTWHMATQWFKGDAQEDGYQQQIYKNYLENSQQAEQAFKYSPYQKQKQQEALQKVIDEIDYSSHVVQEFKDKRKQQAQLKNQKDEISVGYPNDQTADEDQQQKEIDESQVPKKIIQDIKEKYRIFPIQQNVAQNLSPKYFDFIIESFGLCSYEDPVKALLQAKELLKDDGEILLVEHGQSSWLPIINPAICHRAEQHHKNWGCRPDKNIIDIISEADLQIEEWFTWHLGTIYYIRCRKPSLQFAKKKDEKGEWKKRTRTYEKYFY